MKDKPGSIVGGVLLVAGSCIGAGMLALPIVTGLSGLTPSLFIFLLAWAFMTATGYLLVEVNSWFPQRVNIITMAEKTLGPIGKALGWILYLFLFYSLLVAYIAGSGSLAATYSIPSWAGSIFFAGLFGAVAYQGTHTVDKWNRVLMVGKIVTYMGMVFLGLRYVEPHLLTRVSPSYALISLPILIVSFGYHNMIPTLMAYMKGDAHRVRMTIWTGSLFALIVYLIWNIIVLGIVPPEGTWGLFESWKAGRQASDAVAGLLGISWMSTFAEGLAFFALLTSFMAQTLALIHFLADGLKIKSEKHETVSLCFLALAPPLILALIYPQLFLAALGFAGGFCAVILFGILPICMTWIGRYRQGVVSTYVVKGGKPLLIGLFLFALVILSIQLVAMIK
ncbi:MAG: tyrosine transporter [Verrucomicrobia bacterium]|nr:tyrosine transporter [Verrucomicrobiota bacterium]